jgi:hypothetical protein
MPKQCSEGRLSPPIPLREERRPSAELAGFLRQGFPGIPGRKAGPRFSVQKEKGHRITLTIVGHSAFQNSESPESRKYEVQLCGVSTIRVVVSQLGRLQVRWRALTSARTRRFAFQRAFVDGFCATPFVLTLEPRDLATREFFHHLLDYLRKSYDLPFLSLGLFILACGATNLRVWNLLPANSWAADFIQLVTILLCFVIAIFQLHQVPRPLLCPTYKI